MSVLKKQLLQLKLNIEGYLNNQVGTLRMQIGAVLTTQSLCCILDLFPWFCKWSYETNINRCKINHSIMTKEAWQNMYLKQHIDEAKCQIKLHHRFSTSHSEPDDVLLCSGWMHDLLTKRKRKSIRVTKKKFNFLSKPYKYFNPSTNQIFCLNVLSFPCFSFNKFEC